MVKDMNNNYYYLSHHGINGQKWGIRRFQNEDGSLTAAGRARYGISQTGRKKKAKPIVDYSKLSDEERYNAKREAIRTGNVKEANANSYYYSNRDIQDVLDRYDMQRKVKSIAEKDVKTGKQKIEEVISYMGLVAKAAENGVRIWNTTAKVSNSVLGTDLPVISDNNKRNKKNSASSKDVLNTANKIIDSTNRGKNNTIGKKQNQIDKQKNEMAKKDTRYSDLRDDFRSLVNDEFKDSDRYDEIMKKYDLYNKGERKKRNKGNK